MTPTKQTHQKHTTKIQNNKKTKQANTQRTKTKQKINK